MQIKVFNADCGPRRQPNLFKNRLDIVWRTPYHLQAALVHLHRHQQLLNHVHSSYPFCYESAYAPPAASSTATPPPIRRPAGFITSSLLLAHRPCGFGGRTVYHIVKGASTIWASNPMEQGRPVQASGGASGISIKLKIAASSIKRPRPSGPSDAKTVKKKKVCIHSFAVRRL
jgi:hypothetical protein